MSRPALAGLPAYDRHVAFWRRVGWRPASRGEWRGNVADAATFVVDGNVPEHLRFEGIFGVAEIIERWLHSGRIVKAERAARALADYINRVRRETHEAGVS